MEEVSVSTIQELRDRVQELQNRFGRHSLGEVSIKNNVLYRGQADSRWRLESTLERSSESKWTLKRYYELIKRIRPALESYYSITFPALDHKVVENWFTTVAPQIGVVNIPNYEYLLYLRHHGFPSPLLDWTASMYVAIGFAFFPDTEAENRSIYMLIETPEGMKGAYIGEPEIATTGAYVKTHKRHFLQQADYTICFSRSENIPLEKYDSVAQGSAMIKQDLLWKFNIPSTERGNILRFLSDVNVNPFSLMPTKENLLFALWIKEEVLPSIEFIMLKQ